MTLENPGLRRQVGGVLYVEASETLTDVADAGTNTTVFDARAFHNKLIKLENATDVTVDITIQSVDDTVGTDPRTVGSVENLTAGSKSEVHITDYHPFIRFNVNPTGNSTGDVIIKVFGQRR